MKINKYVNTVNKGKYLREIMEARFKVFLMIVFLVMLIIITRLLILTTYNQSYYERYIENATLKKVSPTNAPRGRIYDRNGKLLVDNVMVKTIYYLKPSGVTINDELKVAAELNRLIKVNYEPLTMEEQIKYWQKLHPNLSRRLLTKKEERLYQERNLTKDEINSIIQKRILEKELVKFTKEELANLSLYKKMNIGYSYAEKTIKNSGVSDAEYLKILEYQSLIPGVHAKLEPVRKYLYGDTFRAMIGKVSNSKVGLPIELKDYYLANGYQLNDQVGISNLELQYENILRGIKPTYTITREGYQEIKAGRRGQDLQLTIDIDLQQYVEQVLTKEIIAAKKEPNTKYYNRSFVIITEPKTGDILAMAGKQITESGKIVDFTPGIITQPVTAGSIVKGASHIVGYNTGAIKVGAKVLDECIKLKATPQKCSWKNLGLVDDIGALAYSSNSFQFKTAMKVAGANYHRDSPLIFKNNPFNIYRQVYAEFGLGVKTNIKFANESLGNRGTDTINGQILDFAIGQYDTYTPLQISSYINTLANKGRRMELNLLKAVYEPGISNDLTNMIYQKEPTLLNKVHTKSEYLERVITGFRGVMVYGTGVGYMGNAPEPAGKTGTSQSFIDTNNDGLVDQATLSNTFGGFAPYNNPKMSITVVSPDVKSNTAINFKTGVNKRITSQISTYFFTNH